MAALFALWLASARHQQRLERSLRAWDVARRAYFAGDLDEATYLRDKEHYEGEIAMLRGEVSRMTAAEQECHARETALVQLAAISGQWTQINAELTADEKREIVWALVQDVTVSRRDEVTVVGALTPIGCSNRLNIGSA